jgi:DNA-binding XRE family transcriptional regulator
MDLGLTQREVAFNIGANQWTVANWEKGRTEPASRFIAKIADFLMVPNHRDGTND